MTSKKAPRERLRTGFSTGTAATAAARAALRFLLTGESAEIVAVRLPAGYFIPVPIAGIFPEGEDVLAVVIKDGGDDPDVTHKAEMRARVRCACRTGQVSHQEFSRGDSRLSTPDSRSGICLIGGEGVGVVTKPGLPVKMGEPAINPVPREMLARNLTEELLGWKPGKCAGTRTGTLRCNASKPRIFLPFSEDREHLKDFLLEVEIEVPRGVELARHTLNPRLGIQGGLSILGTTGIVKPFSHKAYEETIEAALKVAASNGCREVVLSTGGKSERLARNLLSRWPVESFVQIADFFAFAVGETFKMGFQGIVHSAFFGKVVKMAQGHAYTHAHEVPLDLDPLARLAREKGYDADFCREIAEANTARHALELLLARNDVSVIRTVARQALEQSSRLAEDRLKLRLLVFDYDGTLLVDVEREGAGR